MINFVFEKLYCIIILVNSNVRNNDSGYGFAYSRTVPLSANVVQWILLRRSAMLRFDFLFLDCFPKCFFAVVAFVEGYS